MPRFETGTVEQVVQSASGLQRLRVRVGDELRDAAMLAAGWRKVIRVYEEEIWQRRYTWTDTIEYAKITGHKTAAEVAEARAAKAAEDQA